MSLYRRLLCLSPAVIASLGCMTETVTVVPLWAVVYGTVRSEAGSPVPGARVTMRAELEGACPATAHTNVNVATYEAFSDENGAFRAEVKNDLWPHVQVEDFCVHVVVTPPVAEGLRDTAFSVGPIRFSPIVSDSARADVVLPPS
jgi:hypothetical protein